MDQSPFRLQMGTCTAAGRAARVTSSAMVSTGFVADLELEGVPFTSQRFAAPFA